MLFLTPADLHGLEAGALEKLLERTDLTVAFGDGEVGGSAAAVLLFADYAVLTRDASLVIDTPEAWAAAVWRLERRSVGWFLRGAPEAEIVDEITELDPDAWLVQWMAGRSSVALDAAAALIRTKGGDGVEREEFARLFSAGEPQAGLEAFLSRKRPDFGAGSKR